MVRSEERPNKRQRMDYDDVDDDEDRDIRPKRTIASTVVMPSIETKSREEKIEEMNKTEKKEVTTRNRRMFSNLLMGTLTRFQRDEKKVQNVEKIQAEKQLEVEKRLEDKKREDREKVITTCTISSSFFNFLISGGRWRVSQILIQKMPFS
ncbi:hypothetical protein COOONC_20047 [Cooperia oncophora]